MGLLTVFSPSFCGHELEEGFRVCCFSSQASPVHSMGGRNRSVKRLSAKRPLLPYLTYQVHRSPAKQNHVIPILKIPEREAAEAVLIHEQWRETPPDSYDREHSGP